MFGVYGSGFRAGAVSGTFYSTFELKKHLAARTPCFNKIPPTPAIMGEYPNLELIFKILLFLDRPLERGLLHLIGCKRFRIFFRG